MDKEGQIKEYSGYPCPKRRYHPGIEKTVNAGSKELVFSYKGSACVRQLGLYYDGNNSTGTYNCKLIIRVDGATILDMSMHDIVYRFCTNVVSAYSDRPLICTRWDNTNKIYCFIFHDLGYVRDNLEVWFENVDTSNSCVVRVGMVYDVLE